MPEIKKGNFSLDLKFFKLSADLSEDDRQCAWELYTEIVTRVSVIGKRGDTQARDFKGEVYAESFSSLYNFFQECRGIMRKFPVGKINEIDQEHLGVLAHRILTDVLRPFLEKWQGPYRTWWQQQDLKGQNPLDVQNKYPEIKAMLEDWHNVRLIMRKVASTLCKTYQLKEVDEHIEPRRQVI